MKKRSAVLIISVVMVAAALCTSVGLSAAYWTAGEGGAPAAAPGAYTTDWNSWAKYFTAYDSDSLEASLSGFSGTDLPDVIIPSYLNGRKVTSVNNTVFGNTTLKQIPVTLSVAPTVKTVAPMTFSSLPNLVRVTIGDKTTESAYGITFGEYCFSACGKLKNIVCLGSGSPSRVIEFGANSLLGCSVTITADGAVVKCGSVVLSEATVAQFAAASGAISVVYSTSAV